MVSLGLMEHPNTQAILNHLLHFWDEAGQGDRKEQWQELLVPEIVQVEAEMRNWVAEDPDNRHFGPRSPIAGAMAQQDD